MRKRDILYESGQYWVSLEQTGKSQSYKIWKHGATHSTKVATIGKSMGWPRVLAEIQRRKELDTMKKNPSPRPGRYASGTIGHSLVRRKKPRTAAQKAATKKLVAMMKARRQLKAIRKNNVHVRAARKRNRVVKVNPARGVRKLRPVGQKFSVQVKRKSAWMTLCSFAQLAMAKEYATALHRKYPSQTIRVFSK